MSSLEAWLKENKLMAYKDVFEEQVDDLNDLSSEILEDDEEIIDFIEEEIGVYKQFKQMKILYAIKKLQRKLSTESNKKEMVNILSLEVEKQFETQQLKQITLDREQSEDEKMISSVVDDLSVAQQDVIKMLQEKYGKQMVSISRKMEANVSKIENKLLKMVTKLKVRKNNLDDDLVSNRQACAIICAQIDSTQSIIEGLESDLSHHESRLSDLLQQVADLERDIDRKKREAETQKTRRNVISGVGVAVGVIGLPIVVVNPWLAVFYAEELLATTGAVAGGVGSASAALHISSRKLESQATELKNHKKDAEKDIRNTRNEKNSLEREKNSLNNEKLHLKDCRKLLDKESKQIGQQIVTISNAIKNMKEVRIKCNHLNGDIDIVRELAGADLMEYRKGPLNEISIKITGAKSNLSAIAI